MNIKTVYAVFQEGVYRHTCCGIYSDRERAINAAKFFVMADKDSYHHYDVIPFILNNVPGLSPSLISYMSPQISEESPIYSIDKDSV